MFSVLKLSKLLIAAADEQLVSSPPPLPHKSRSVIVEFKSWTRRINNSGNCGNNGRRSQRSSSRCPIRRRRQSYCYYRSKQRYRCVAPIPPYTSLRICIELKLFKERKLPVCSRPGCRVFVCCGRRVTPPLQALHGCHVCA